MYKICENTESKALPGDQVGMWKWLAFNPEVWDWDAITPKKSTVRTLERPLPIFFLIPLAYFKPYKQLRKFQLSELVSFENELLVMSVKSLVEKTLVENKIHILKILASQCNPCKNLAIQYISCKILPGNIFIARNQLFGRILQRNTVLPRILQDSATIMHYLARFCKDLVTFARILQEMYFSSTRQNTFFARFLQNSQDHCKILQDLVRF